MSNPLTVYITLVDEGSVDTNSRKIIPVSYSLSPDRTEVILGADHTEAAVFVINELPPFLREKRGLYLGHLYIPQLYIDNRGYYLQVTSRKNHYRLVDEMESDDLFGFSILQPQLKWQERAEIDKIHFENFDPGNATHFFLATRPRSRSRAIYSPTDCRGDENYCGLFTPDSDGVEGVGFGLRGRNVVYTYKVSPDQKMVTVAATPTFLVTADLETNDTVRERYFFADLQGTEQFKSGVDYPIYIWVNGQKRYLSKPQRHSENGPTTYELTARSEEDTARFSPMTVANWREMTLTPNDFINLAFNNISELALWRDESYQGRPAVVSADNPSLSTVAPALLASHSQTEPTSSTIVTPFWTQWWFWLLIGLLILLLIVLIVILTRPRTPKVTTVYRNVPVSYVKSA